MPDVDHLEIEKSVRSLFSFVGEDPDRDGLKRTPERYAKSMKFLSSGYATDVKAILEKALFDVEYSDMVIVRDIELYSLCEHHLLPFYGRCHVGYIPSKKVVGLSKIPRVVDAFARRFQVQERLTNQIAEAIQQTLKPLGVGVVVEAFHLCMMMRGVEKQHSYTTTSSMHGVFQKPETRDEFLKLVYSPKRGF